MYFKRWTVAYLNEENVIVREGPRNFVTRFWAEQWIEASEFAHLTAFYPEIRRYFVIKRKEL